MEQLDALLYGYEEFLNSRLGLNVKDMALEFRSSLERQAEIRRDDAEELIKHIDANIPKEHVRQGDMTTRDLIDLALGSRGVEGSPGKLIEFKKREKL